MPYPDESTLTTPSAVKAWLGVEDSNADELISGLITRVSQILFHKTNRKYLLSRTYKDTFNGGGRERHNLNIYPVTSIVSVSVNSSILTPATSHTAKGFYLDQDGVNLRGHWFDYGGENCEVVYVAGIEAGGVEWGILEQAALEAINFKWERREHPDQSAQNLGNQITAKYIDRDLPLEVIDAIRRVTRDTPLSGFTTIVPIVP